MKALFLAVALLALTLNVALAKSGAKKNQTTNHEPRPVREIR
jgi:hypothetical protein